MPALAPNTSSDCSNPVLDVFMSVNGQSVDVSSLEFQIFEKVTDPENPVQVFPVAGRETVDVVQDCPTGHRLSTGRYVAEYSVPAGELIGTHEIRWFFKLTPSSAEQTFVEEFEVVPVLAAASPGLYCTVQSIRDEGAPASLTDAFIENRIRLASRTIDAMTGRFFSPVAKTVKVDGRGTTEVLLREPIIDITKIQVELLPGTGDIEDIDLADVSIYNRHLTLNLTDPDDRNNPKISFNHTELKDIRLGSHAQLPLRAASAFLFFPAGHQNVTIEGTFGYTDYDGSPAGRTPDLICHACQLLTLNMLANKIKKTGPQATGSIWKQETRDQRVEYGDPSRMAIQGAFTGITEVDQIIARYRRPMHLGAV